MLTKFALGLMGTIIQWISLASLERWTTDLASTSGQAAHWGRNVPWGRNAMTTPSAPRRNRNSVGGHDSNLVGLDRGCGTYELRERVYAKHLRKRREGEDPTESVAHDGPQCVIDACPAEASQNS